MWELFLYRLSQWISLWFPIRASYFIADLVGDGHFFFSHKDRISVIRNLEVIYGETERGRLRQKARKVFHNFGRYLVEFLRFPRLDRDAFVRNVAIDGLEHLDAALSRGKGAIGVSAHIGNWELGAAGLSLLGYRINTIVQDHPNPAVNRLFIQLRVKKNIRVISRGQPVWEILPCLSKNEILLMAGDRDFAANGIVVTFFNQPAVLPKGPATLSLRSGSPLLIVFMVREGERRLRLRFEPPIFPKKGGSFKERLLSMTQEVAQRLEKQIKQDPSQWLIFQPFWKTVQEER